MSRRVDSIFARYEFESEQEFLQAQTFSDLQLQHLQNELAVAAETGATVIYDPLNPQLAGLQNAYFRGQVDILKFILGISEDRKSELQKLLEAKVKEQQAS